MRIFLQPTFWNIPFFFKDDVLEGRNQKFSREAAATAGHKLKQAFQTSAL